MSEPKKTIDPQELLKVRDEIYKRVCAIRRERDFCNEHKFEVEAKVKHEIKDELERAMYGVERLLDLAGVKYSYAD